MSAFNMAWDFPAELAGPGQLPTPLNTIYVDFQAAGGGTGTSGSPYNDFPGLTTGDTRVNAGTRVVCRGTYRTTDVTFGQILRQGTAADPIVYVGNDPAWGSASIDGSVQLTPSACANIGEAKGNTNWAVMRKATIGAGLGGNHVDDYLHCMYGGTDREIRYLSGYPQLANLDAFDYEGNFARPASWLDVIWYPGIDEGAPVINPGVSKPRIDLVAANTAMGFAAGFLQAALDTDCVPLILMRVRPNVWLTARAGRCNADGTLNASGAYLTVIDGTTLGAENVGAPYDYDDFWYRILNVPKAIDRAGTYAMNPAAGWLVEWPFGSETIHRAQGKSGIEIGKNYVWLHGFKICGMSCSKTVTYPIGPNNISGNSLTFYDGVDPMTCRVQRCYFPAFGSVGVASRSQAYLSGSGVHFIAYFNTFKFQAIGSAIEMGTGGGGRIQFNDFDYIHGSNVRCIGTHMRDTIIGGNRITNVNDIHGNGITLYISKYSVIIEYNLIKNVGRPSTVEMNNAYDAAYGTPSTIFRNNTWLASGDGTAATLRVQQGSETGISIIDNNLDGSILGITPWACSAFLSTTLNGPVTGNVGIGPAPSGAAGTLWDAGVNTLHANGSPGGDAARAAWTAMTVPDPVYAPQGVGHLAGGWDGLS